MDTGLREACGVMGVCGHDDAPRLTYYGLYALQHRGQESAGMVVRSDDGSLRVQRGMGLVSEVFEPGDLDGLKGRLALGHVRYSTHGPSDITNAQPLLVKYHGGQVALAHNGNFVNAEHVRADLEDKGTIFQSTSDTEIVAHLLAQSGQVPVEDALVGALDRLQGGYALQVLTPGALIGVRDPSGIRPLVLGATGDGGHILASESCALDVVGATLVREVEPGEMLVLREGSEPASFRINTAAGSRPALCIFEYIYFARPDSNLQGQNVHLVRKRLGQVLAREHPVEADVVSGVPDSSISAAAGYAEEAGIPYQLGLIKNRYIGRTFIQPRQSQRDLGVRLKLNPIRQVVAGQRVVLVDDSIVRGTTSRHLVRLLRDVGAREVHLRITSPPYQYPCYYGIDTSTSGELLAAGASVEEIREIVGADTLAFISQAGAALATGQEDGSLCTACFDGCYPVLVPGEEG